MSYSQELEKKNTLKREVLTRALIESYQISVRRKTRGGQNQDGLRDDTATIAFTGIYGEIGAGLLLGGIRCRCGSEVRSKEGIH